jgi:hypothetical protein
VVLAVTGMGLAKVACCHPLADSLVNVAKPRRVPALVQTLPTWVPAAWLGL